MFDSGDQPSSPAPCYEFTCLLYGLPCADLAECGKGEGALQEIGPVILQRLGRNGDQWPQAYKALVLAEHLVLHSDPAWSRWVHNEAVEAVQALQYFQYVDSDGEDWVSAVESCGAGVHCAGWRPGCPISLHAAAGGPCHMV